MSPTRVALSLALLIIHSAFWTFCDSISVTEREALLNLRSSLGIRARDWPRKADPCAIWVGIQCDRNERVVTINISNFKRTRVGRLDPRFAVGPLVNLTHLATFNASGFALPGPIPDWLGPRLPALQVLDLRSCSVDGVIPSTVRNLTNLNSLLLSRNNLTGIIPSALGRLSSLAVLDLGHNSFTGPIPTSFANLGNLSSLDLSFNYLSGSIPGEIGMLGSLKSLNLSGNSFSSGIPPEIGNLSGLVELDLGFNALSGSVPAELGGLRSLERLVAGNNSLSGELPERAFSRMERLNFVVFRFNSMSGRVPESLWGLPGLSFLDISYNNFTGVLPNVRSNGSAAIFNLSHNQFYGNLSAQFERFSFIDLSDNYFQGRVLGDYLGNVSLVRNCLRNVLNQKTLEECRLFYSEKGLVFDDFGIINETQPVAPEPARKRKKRLVYILAGIFGGLAFIVVLVVLVVCFSRTRERGSGDQEGRGVTPATVGGGANTPPVVVSLNFSNLGDSFTYDQLLRVTGDFSDSNFIKHGHSGDLFKGILENGTIVVVKRVDMDLIKKGSYMAELELLSKISHNRLVPLLGHCLERENEKLLVYKYMPNGDLFNSLHRKTDPGDDSLQSLDWITRLKIAIGAAEGLSYLHHECNPPLIHRRLSDLLLDDFSCKLKDQDVQASSIFLDDKYEVRLGSLSEVCPQEGDIHQNVISRLLRLPQTSEQGSSGTPSATCAYDVYCFGKVLLELVTGKLGISASIDASTTEWLEQTLPYISIYERELVTKIVDPSLIIDEDLLEEVWAMAIVARSCLNPKPSRRPLMRFILKALENPLKVVREENLDSARLRTTSSRSWNASLFGSWRHSSSDIVTSTAHKEGSSSLKRSGTAGSQGSERCGERENPSSHKRLSRDIFPEPAEEADIERPNGD
ncbi:hypothetical protein Sjap_010361 [Stephania japonica]|uniref:Protein kinase domain-containing protein n=1 Tax=Stephania japonica TaxID=461633 RepID=A0AAP0J9G0_9MAGN